MKKLRDLSISQQLFIFIFICITLVMTIFMFIITSALQKYLIDKAALINDDRAALVVQGIETNLTTSEEYVLMLASDSRLQQSMYQYKYLDTAVAKNDAANIAAKAFSATVLSDKFRGAVLLDTKGEYIYTNSHFKPDDLAASVSEELCRETLETSRPVWGNELLSLEGYTNPGTYTVLPLYKVLRNVDNGEFLGYVILLVDEASFENLYASTNTFSSGSYYLVNKNNIVVSASDANALNQSLPEALEWMTWEDVSELHWGKNPVQYVSTYISEANQRLLLLIPMSELTAQKLSLWLIAVCSIVTVIIILGLCTLKISAEVTRPIVELTEVMASIEQRTDMSVRVDNKKYSGEQAVLASGFNRLMERLQKAMDDIYLQQRQKRRMELKLLQGQMNPHFLYNTLETISSLLMLNMSDKAMEICKHLSEFYKLSLSKGRDIITLEEEFRIAEDYLRIQSIRYVEYMEYSLECEDSILDCYVPKLLIQPLIENGIYHGLRQQKKVGMLLVTGQSDDSGMRVVLEIIDTGNGIEPDKLAEINQIIEQGKTSTVSFGISNVAARLKNLFGEQCSITLTSTSGVATKVRLEFPMVKKEDPLYSEWRRQNEGLDR